MPGLHFSRIELALQLHAAVSLVHLQRRHLYNRWLLGHRRRLPPLRPHRPHRRPSRRPQPRPRRHRAHLLRRYRPPLPRRRTFVPVQTHPAHAGQQDVVTVLMEMRKLQRDVDTAQIRELPSQASYEATTLARVQELGADGSQLFNALAARQQELDALRTRELQLVASQAQLFQALQSAESALQASQAQLQQTARRAAGNATRCRWNDRASAAGAGRFTSTAGWRCRRISCSGTSSGRAAESAC